MHKRQPVDSCLLREGISFLWGIAKNYIMYWGVTSSIIASPPLHHKNENSQILQFDHSIFVSFAQTALQTLSVQYVPSLEAVQHSGVIRFHAPE